MQSLASGGSLDRVKVYRTDTWSDGNLGYVNHLTLYAPQNT